MQDEFDGSPSTQNAGRGWKVWLLVAVVLLASSGAFFFFAERNASRIYLEQRNGQLVIEKGIYFPGGKTTLDSDPLYNPIELPAGYPFEQTDFPKDELDTRLLAVFIEAASHAMRQGSLSELEKSQAFIRRAKLLPEITAESKQEITRVEGEKLYIEGLLHLQSVQKSLIESKSFFNRSRIRRGSFNNDVPHWLKFIENQIDAQQSVTARLKEIGVLVEDLTISKEAPEELPKTAPEPQPVKPPAPTLTIEAHDNGVDKADDQNPTQSAPIKTIHSPPTSPPVELKKNIEVKTEEKELKLLEDSKKNVENEIE
jgi:hypothetical protein